jgi:hypothetical protein
LLTTWPWWRHVRIQELESDFEVVAAENAVGDLGAGVDELSFAFKEKLERHLPHMANCKLVLEGERQAGGTDIKRTPLLRLHTIHDHDCFGAHDLARR